MYILNQSIYLTQFAMRYPVLFSKKNCKYDLYDGLILYKYDQNQYINKSLCGKKNIVTK